MKVEKSEEMLMPTNTLKMGSVALYSKWSLSHTHKPITGDVTSSIMLFRKCCSSETAFFVNSACY